MKPNGLTRIVPFWEVDNSTVSRPFRSPRLGEIIVFRFPGEPRRDFVKRVIGLPGDEVAIVEGRVIVNGTVYSEPYLNEAFVYNMAPLRMKEREYFVMGDNRAHSNDSRNWGPGAGRKRGRKGMANLLALLPSGYAPVAPFFLPQC